MVHLQALVHMLSPGQELTSMLKIILNYCISFDFDSQLNYLLISPNILAYFTHSLFFYNYLASSSAMNPQYKCKNIDLGIFLLSTFNESTVASNKKQL